MEYMEDSAGGYALALCAKRGDCARRILSAGYQMQSP